MSIVFDQEVTPSGILFYDASADTFSSERAGLSVHDYFDDDSAVDDCLYFTLYVPRPFHDVKFFIGTPLVADAITVVWEYYSDGSWIAIPSVTDNTNSFQNAGEQWVRFNVPDKMRTSVSNMNLVINGQQRLGIRCRITAVTNITEGGAQSTQAVKIKDHCITTTSETDCTFKDIYNADVAGGWGVVTSQAEGMYHFDCNLYFSGGNLLSKRETVQIGNPDRYWLVWNSQTHTFQCGELSNLKGKNGSCITYWTGFSYYTKIYNWLFYASYIYRNYGAFGNFQPGLLCKFYDSILASENIYFFAAVSAGTKWVRSYYDVPSWIYIYDTDFVIESIVLSDGCLGSLTGGSGIVTISNTDYRNASGASKYAVIYHTATVNLIDCYIDNDQLTFDNVGAGLKNGYVKFTFNLNLTDEYNTAIETATVKLTNNQGTQEFSVSTDVNGDIAEQTITIFTTQVYDGASGWGKYDITHNPFTLEISVAGYKKYKHKLTLDEPYIKLQLKADKNKVLNLSNNVEISD
jgi:hypothetical protein